MSNDKNNPFPVVKTEKDWKAQLSPEQYYVLREKGTERPFTGKLLENKDKGIYVCAACGHELFKSDQKFDSHCGWPSFDGELKSANIKKVLDKSFGMVRTEIVCSNCGGHLGHVFIGERFTNKNTRHCVNSISLKFIASKDVE